MMFSMPCKGKCSDCVQKLQFRDFVKLAIKCNIVFFFFFFFFQSFMSGTFTFTYSVDLGQILRKLPQMFALSTGIFMKKKI